MQEYTADHKMTSSQNIHNIDVSKMSEKEICSLLRIKSVPWYKDVFFLVVVVSYYVNNYYVNFYHVDVIYCKVHNALKFKKNTHDTRRILTSYRFCLSTM